MDTSAVDPIKLMLEVISENTPRSAWTNAPLEAFRRVENTNRGDIGEQFIERYLAKYGIRVTNPGSRAGLVDRIIEGKTFEIKTASQDANGNLQFNHVRLDRQYEYLLCVGVCPDRIVCNVWSKAEVQNRQAGTLVQMAQDQDITYKLTKRPVDMRRIEELPHWVRRTLVENGDEDSPTT